MGPIAGVALGFGNELVPGDRLVIAVERVRVRPRAMIVCRFQGIVGENIVVDGIIKGLQLPVDYLLEAAGDSIAEQMKPD